MTLADAIRKGAMQRPQAREFMFSRTADVRSCALGAAYEGVYGTVDSGPISQAGELCLAFPELNTAHVYCPTCGEGASLWYVVGDHLNDSHGWTREAIADWLDSRPDTSAEPRA